MLITGIYLAIFRFPNAARNLLVSVFSTRLLKRWKKGAEETGNDLMVTSGELRTKPFSFWVKDTKNSGTSISIVEGNVSSTLKSFLGVVLTPKNLTPP